MTDRHQFRARWHNYEDGTYFVTICCAGRKHLFGHISDGKMRQSTAGKIVERCIADIPAHHKNVEIHNYVVMPNHLHMVISVGAQYIAPASSQPSDIPSVIGYKTNMGCLHQSRHDKICEDFHFNSPLAVVIRTFKAACTRLLATTLRAQCIAPLPVLRQRNYHEHIIRDRRSFDYIMYYIDTNIENWHRDCFNNLSSTVLN